MLEFAARRASAGGTDETEYRITDLASRNGDGGKFGGDERGRGAAGAVAGSGGAAAESGACAWAGANDEGSGTAERRHKIDARTD